MQIGECTHMTSAATDPELVHQSLTAAGIGRTAGACAFAYSLDPHRARLNRNDSPLLFDHCKLSPDPERIERAIRSAVPTGISPTTVTIRSPFSVDRRRATVAVGPNGLRATTIDARTIGSRQTEQR